MRRIGVGVVSLWLISCGFALRQPFQFAFSQLEIQGGGVVATSVRSALQRSKVLRTGSQTADVILVMLTDERTRLAVGTTSTGQVREMQLRHRVVYELRHPKGYALTETTELSAERDVAYTETVALSKQAEEDLLYHDMEQEITQRLIRHLAALKSQNLQKLPS